MTAPDKPLGALVQSYVRARWGEKADREAAERIAERLDSRLRERVDVLGSDVDHLLAVPQEQVLQELQALEKEAALEDAGVRTKAARVRAREEMQIDDPAKASRRNPRVPQGKHRAPGRHGRRGERRQR